MLRHDHVTGNCKEIAQPNALQCVFKKLHGRDRRKIWPTAETTECQEVKIPCLLITNALALHTLREYSNWERYGQRGFHPRSPKARDRGHPHLGLKRSSGPGTPIFIGGARVRNPHYSNVRNPHT